VLDLLKKLALEYGTVARLSRDILDRLDQSDLEDDLKKLVPLLEARAAALDKAESCFPEIEERGGWDLLFQGLTATGSTQAEELIETVRQAAQEANHLGGEVGLKLEQRQADVRGDMLKASQGGRLMKGYQGFGVRLPYCLNRQA